MTATRKSIASTSDVEYVRGLLSLVTYRPGWTITAHKTPFHDRVWLLIDAEVYDAEDISITTNIGVRAVVPYVSEPEYDVAGEFYSWLAWRLIRIERHESREFFQVGGVPWDSPHRVAQPESDYLVRQHRVDKTWTVIRVRDNLRFTGWSSQQAAYADAWRRVIEDDCSKGSDMVNG